MELRDLGDDSRNLMDFHLSCDEPGNVSDAEFITSQLNAF